MLKFLSITNLAVVTRLNFDLEEGLNLLTGETGAGKSIIVDALTLLMGGKATVDMIRTGERAALVESLFELNGEEESYVRKILEEVGIDANLDEYLSIRREVQSSGRTRTFINDKSVTVATLKRLQPFLIEIHGQGEQQSLSNARAQMDVLDVFAGNGELRREVGSAYARWKKAVDTWRSLERDEAARERAVDMLRFQISEIEKVEPLPGEDEALLAEKSLLGSAERVLELSSGAYAELYERDQSVLDQLASVRRRIQHLSAIDGRVGQMLETIDAATVALRDAAESLRDYGGGVVFSPARLSEIERRLAELERLKQRHGRDLQGLLEVKEDLKKQIQQLSDLAEQERELLSEVETAASAYAPLAEKLSANRRLKACLLERRVTEELRQVALERARFNVSLETAKPDMSDFTADDPTHRPATPVVATAEPVAPLFWTSYGADRVEFLISANVGESPRPLGRVASGGELSRIMLALRTVCSATESTGGRRMGSTTLVFDEIDAGIGGRTAESVGQRLRALAFARQVLCVTHQAQIARFADHHYSVAKRVEGARTMISVQRLDREERIGELARMIGGAETVATARETAVWMLENSGANIVQGDHPDGPAKISSKKKASSKSRDKS